MAKPNARMHTGRQMIVSIFAAFPYTHQCYFLKEQCADISSTSSSRPNKNDKQQLSEPRVKPKPLPSFPKH
jgi:hypothetical protein